MPAWSWFIVAVVLGGAMLALAVLADRRSRRRATGADEPAPRRGIDDVDRHVPHYLTQDEIDAMPTPSAGRGPAPVSPRGEGFGFGHAHADFANHRDGAAYTQPSILVVDGDVTAVRELLTPLGRAGDEHPLVIVAAGIHPEVLTTLTANRRALAFPVVAAVAGSRDRTRLAELLGVAPIPLDDLRSGYLPDQAYGRAASWFSTLKRTWVEPADLP